MPVGGPEQFQQQALEATSRQLGLKGPPSQCLVHIHQVSTGQSAHLGAGSGVWEGV